MNYYYDTEFLEGTQVKKILGIKVGNTKPTIDLISIGIVSEDGREYYAVSKDFNLHEAWNRYDVNINGGRHYWIRENVLLSIYRENYSGDARNYFDFSYSTMKRLIEAIGKSNNQISKEIRHFIAGRENERSTEEWILDSDSKNTQLYGYYSNYDHVVFCWLFGKMINLPKGYPMYTKDLKQMSDEIYQEKRDEFYAKKKQGFINSLADRPDYPRQSNEHNALDDAKWNKRLHDFLTRVKKEDVK